MNRLIRFLGKRVLILALSYLVIVILVAVFQDKLLFHPRPLSEDQDSRAAKRAGATKMTIRNGGKELTAYFGAAKKTDGKSRFPTVVYFGGNGQNLASTALTLKYVNEAGWNTVLCFYRGYGRSEGTPSTEAFISDALAWFEAIAELEAVDPNRMVAWGRSLGTGVAVHAALRGTPRAKAIILTSPFTRLRDAAHHRFPWLPTRLLLRHELNSIDIVQKTPRDKQPRVLILHGAKDEIIPISQGRELAQAFGIKAKVVEFPAAGHNDLGLGLRYRSSVLDFLSEQ